MPSAKQRVLRPSLPVLLPPAAVTLSSEATPNYHIGSSDPVRDASTRSSGPSREAASPSSDVGQENVTVENFIEDNFNVHRAWKESSQKPQPNIGEDNTYRLTGRELKEYALGAAGDTAAFALAAAGPTSHQWTDEDEDGDEGENADGDSDLDWRGGV